jgi:hypothetical protein
MMFGFEIIEGIFTVGKTLKLIQILIQEIFSILVSLL